MIVLNNVERVSDDLYVVMQEMRPGWFCSVVVLIGGEKIGIVDTGYENTPSDFVFPLILELGRELDDVNYVVNTHRDGDHIRGNVSIKEKTNAFLQKCLTFQIKEEVLFIGKKLPQKMKRKDYVKLKISQKEMEEETQDSLLGEGKI